MIELLLMIYGIVGLGLALGYGMYVQDNDIKKYVEAVKVLYLLLWPVFLPIFLIAVMSYLAHYKIDVACHKCSGGDDTNDG